MVPLPDALLPFSFLQFVDNAFWLSFLLLVLVSLAMTAFGFFVAAFMRKVRPALHKHKSSLGNKDRFALWSG